MSEPENPHWLRQVSSELREEVPVRAAWRAKLLDEVARAPRPSPGAGDDETLSDPWASEARRPRRLVLHPLAGLAAAVAFAAVGAATTLAVMTRRAETPARTEVAAAQPASRTAAAPMSDATSDVDIVTFELSAPTATNVALVGSFNRWNPVATPLERDAVTGRWMVSLRLPAGRHVYAFVVDGDITADPAAPRAADADFGTPNSVVLVGGRSS